jgi:hypothetical protein
MIYILDVEISLARLEWAELGRTETETGVESDLVEAMRRNFDRT